jgi:putative nucleotidyltransferase with HDIG domain
MLGTGGQLSRTQERCDLDNQLQVMLGRDRLLSIMERANEIAGAQDTTCMVQRMLDLLIEVSQADSAYLFQLDPSTDELVVTHVRGDAESQYLIGLRLNHQQGLPGISIGDTRTLVVGDLPSDPDWLRSVDLASAVRKRNMINLPIVSGERNLGVVQIFNYQQVEFDLLTVLGNRLALEIDHRNEIEGKSRSNQRLLTLVEMLGQVAGTLDRNQLLHLVTENASRLVDAERSSIFLVDPNTSEMIFQVAYRSPQQEPFTLIPGTFNRSAAGTVAFQLTHQNVDRSAQRASSQGGEFSYFNRSAITVPLHNGLVTQNHSSDDRKHTLGGLMVLNKQGASFQEEDAQLMQILADQASTFLQVAEMYESAGELFLGVIKALITTIEAKDPYTQGHSQRVSDYSVLISQELGLDETLVNDIRIGSLLHDIGKIGIPDSILLKPSKLNERESEIVKEHPVTGAHILSKVKLLNPMAPAIEEHHERLDGSGYPGRFTDKQISQMGRIVAVADVFDAMTSNRPYRPAIGIREVLSYLHEKSGVLFDEICVQAMNSIIARSSQPFAEKITPAPYR